MFAEVFIDLPESFGPKDLRKDLKKAMQHLDRAINFSNYPTNHLDRTTALIKDKRFSEARSSLATAKSILSDWSHHPYAPSWQQTVRSLEKELK